MVREKTERMVKVTTVAKKEKIGFRQDGRLIWRQRRRFPSDDDYLDLSSPTMSKLMPK
jgi:hypothetical protein